MASRKFRFVSPGVFLKEIDNSQLPAIAPGIGPVLIGRTRHGPSMKPYKVSSYEEFVRVFGKTMPGNEGLNGLAEIHALYPDVLVVVITAQEEPDVMAKSLALGASGFIPKSASVDCIIEAVNTVLDGETWVPYLAQMATGTLNKSSAPNHNGSSGDDFTSRLKQLTPHQLKVLRMVSDGLLNKQIAYELAISESTVKQHVSAVLR